MQRDDLVYVGHMLDMARKVLGKVAGLSREDFDGDENLRIAVTHLLQVIGEAASRVSNEFRDAHRDVPWHEIVGMRHKVVHDYLQVDEDVVWDTATEELGPLAESLEQIVPPDPPV
ncbi:MAG: HepT-like ribonuclease domain-containing protein [Planctomycetota bacterium]|jgi:uncharacterized protein with HEPN domain